MTNLANGTVATDLHNVSQSRTLLDQGYTIRHIETYHDQDIVSISCIVWDAPDLTEADLSY